MSKHLIIMMMLTSLLIATQQVNAQCPIPDINDVIFFCTMENDLGITFPADTQHGKEVDYFPLTEYYGHAAGCLKHTNSGDWFTMQIEDPGDLVIMMSHSDNQDIDFACWGPFEGNTKKEMLTNICQNADANFSNSYQITYTDPNPCDEINCNLIQLPSEYAPLEEWDAYYDTTKKCDILHKAQKDDRAKNITDPCFRGFHDLYPYENIIDCSYTTAAKEACYIPNAKKSEWYILLITNYSEKPGDINFNKYSGSATTNCNIIVDANSTGPYCEGDDIELSVNNAPDGTAYAWRGPNGFSSNLQSPTIENSTIDMAGSYYVTLTNNGVKSKETEVIVDVYPSTVRDTTITILPRDSCEIGTVKLKITGTYSIKLTTELGCDSIINLTLNVEDNTIFRGTNNGPYCQGNSIQLSILGDIPTGSSIKWTGPDGFSSNLASPTIPNAEITNGGEYKLKIENEGKVFKTESTLVVVNEKYEIDTTVNVTIGDKITYAGEELTASMTTTIPKTFESIKGCDSIVNLTLEVDTPIVVTSNAGPYCEGSDAKFSVMNVPTDATIEWIGPDGFSSTLTSPEITNVKTVNSGEYELKITRNGVSFMAKPCNLMVIHKYETDTTLHVMIGDKINFGEDKVIAKSSETLTKMFQSQNGCDSVVNLTLVVDTPKVVALNDGPYCEGATAKFSLSNIPTDATVLWHGPSNIASVIEDKTGNSPVINNVKSGDSGEYGLTVTRNGVSFDAVPCILIVNSKIEIDSTVNVMFGDEISFGNENLIATESKTITKTLEATDGCDSIINISLVVDTPMVITSNDGPLCEGSKANFSATNIPVHATLEWEGPASFEDNTDSAPIINETKISDSGTYKLKVTRNGVSFYAQSCELVVNTKIEIDTTMNVVIGDEYIFGNESFIASASQTKTKTFQSASGCDSVVNLTLVVDTPKVITSNDGPYCKDAIVHFSATNVPTDATLEWNGPASLEDNTISSPIINGAKISHSGKYTLKITRNGISFDAEPCELVVSTKMEVDTTINILIGDKINFGNEEIIASKTHTVTKTFQSKSGCDSIVNMTLVVDSPMVITSNAGPYCEGEDASLTASNIPDNATLEWDGPNGFSSNETSPVINNTKPTNSGEYNLKITRNGVSFMATPCELVINPKYNLDTTVHVVIGDKVTIGDKEIIAEKSEIINFSLKTANGCDSIINLSMVVDTPIVVTANAGPYCEGETAILSATNLPDDATFSWSGSNGFSSTEASPKISDVQTTNNGEYKLKITKNGISFMAQPCQLIVNKRYKIDTTMVIAGGESISFGNETLQSTTTKTHTFTSKNGCDSIVTLQLIVVDVITSNSGSICQGGDISFSATGVPDGAQLKWTGPNEFTSEDREPTIKNAQPKNSGEYKLQVTIKGKTYDAKSNSVLVHPTSDIDSFIILSKGNQINFGGILISETGDYHSTFTTVNGCDSTVNLHLIALDLQTSNSGPYCEGESIQLTAENVPDSIESMKWTGPNGFSSSKNVATIKNASVSNSGTYLFSIEMNGNTYEAPSTLVEVHPNVIMKLFQELAFGSTLQFGELVIEKSGNYEQSFTTLEGCDSIVNMTVKVVFPESVAIVPSTHVSPNGDGFNDVWIIENVERYPNSVVTIFDRNGKQLMEYKSYENSNGWDGTDGRGNALPSTDYWYTINIPETDKVYVGHFTLIRK